MLFLTNMVGCTRTLKSFFKTLNWGRKREIQCSFRPRESRKFSERCCHGAETNFLSPPLRAYRCWLDFDIEELSSTCWGKDIAWYVFELRTLSYCTHGQSFSSFAAYMLRTNARAKNLLKLRIHFWAHVVILIAL